MRMSQGTFTDQVQAALKEVANDRRITKAAQEIGIDRHFLYDLIKKKAGNADNVHKIAGWLTSHGYLEGAPANVQPDKPPDLIDVVTSDLEALLTLFKSPMSNEAKMQAWAQKVTFWNGNIREYLRQAEKREGK